MGENLERELAGEIGRALANGSVLEVLAAVNTFLAERGLGRLVIVGGFAVEIYSGGAYRTGDVDVVVEGAADLLRGALGLLEEWRSRVWPRLAHLPPSPIRGPPLRGHGSPLSGRAAC
ncbi:hypothetical protein [Infirmifilum sp. SLHALR2]